MLAVLSGWINLLDHWSTSRMRLRQQTGCKLIRFICGCSLADACATCKLQLSPVRRSLWHELQVRTSSSLYRRPAGMLRRSITLPHCSHHYFPNLSILSELPRLPLRLSVSNKTSIAKKMLNQISSTLLRTCFEFRAYS